VFMLDLVVPFLLDARCFLEVRDADVVMDSSEPEAACMVPIKSLSRLWEYRNGRSPSS